MGNKRIKVIKETDSGRNTKFHDNRLDKDMTRKQFVDEIEKGNYSNYHVRTINDVKTPVSNPDATRDNNLD